MTSTSSSPPHRVSKCWLMRGRGLVFGLLALGGCKSGQPEAPVAAAQDGAVASTSQSGQPEAPVAVAPDAAVASTNPEQARVWMTVGERRFAITLADTDAARAFAARLPLTLDMAELNGNEKHADLSEALPTSASRPGTIHNGDLMLYGSNTVVVFYASFRSPYSYTRLGRVDDPVGLGRALGQRSARVVLSKD